MVGFTVKTTLVAEAHGAALIAWMEERGYARRFATDLDRALRLLAHSPWSGPPSVIAPGVRRFLLRRWQVHLYYSVDSEQKEVIVRALWHSARGAPPTL
jgi:plasmid stabilization system protein ParE